MYTIKLESIDKNNTKVGFKAMKLGELINSGFAVPAGFVLTDEAFRRFMKDSRIEAKISEILSSINYNDRNSIAHASAEIGGMIRNAQFPDFIERHIREEYEELSIGSDAKAVGGIAFEMIKAGRSEVFVAVRPSIFSDEFPYADYEGQMQSFLSVRGNKKLMDSIKGCWTSVFSERALRYRKSKRITRIPFVGVIIQKMLEPQKAGFVFTTQPETNDRNKIVIEGSWGVSEAITSGAVVPDEYIIDKQTGSIVSVNVSKKTWQNRRDEISGKLLKEPVFRSDVERQLLDENEIRKVCDLAVKIERNFSQSPQLVEWMIERNRLYAIEAKPVPSFGSAAKPHEIDGEKISSGLPVCLGFSKGSVCFANSSLNGEHEKSILVAEIFSREMIPMLEQMNGAIVSSGSRMSLAGIACREFGIPCVVNADISSLSEGQKIFLDAVSGQVFKEPETIQQPEIHPQAQSAQENTNKTINGFSGETINRTVSYDPGEHLTATKTAISLPSSEEKIKEADEFLILSHEFIFSDIEKHPFFMARNEPENLKAVLFEKISTLVRSVHPKPVYYKGIDVKSDEFDYLEGSDAEKEQNPLLGFHGIRRNLEKPDLMKCEMEVLRNLREQGVDNIVYILPFVSGAKEWQKAKEITPHGIKAGICIETPASAVDIKNFCKLGIRAAVIDSNTLFQLVLGADRDNVNVSRIYSSEKDAASKLIRHVIRTCRKSNVHVIVSGDITNNLESVESFVGAGVDCIGIDENSFEEVKNIILRTEKRLLLRRSMVY